MVSLFRFPAYLWQEAPLGHPPAQLAQAFPLFLSFIMLRRIRTTKTIRISETTTVPMLTPDPAKRLPNKLISNATIYAKPHWYPMANHVHLALFISLLIAPIAAKQGAQRRLNARKEYPATGVNAAAI